MVYAFADSTDPICESGSSGSLTLSATGGSGTFKYSVNNGLFSDDVKITSLPAGDYSIIAQDINQCNSRPISKTLADPQGIVILLRGIVALINNYYY